MGVAEKRKRSASTFFFAHFLEAFFMSNAEALFFVDHQQTEVGKLHIFGKQAMSANHHVHPCRLPNPRESFFLLRRAAGSELSISIRRRGKRRISILNVFEMLER